MYPYTHDQDHEFEKAICFLSDWYKKSRQNKKPFLIHSLRVANLLMGHEVDAIIITSAILHDVIEDTGCTKIDIKDEFGSDIAELVGRLTITQENIFNYLDFVLKSYPASLIKAADIIDNRQFICRTDDETAQKVRKKHAYFIQHAEFLIGDHPIYGHLIRDRQI